VLELQAFVQERIGRHRQCEPAYDLQEPHWVQMQSQKV
jgi:hypothetical protein